MFKKSIVIFLITILACILTLRAYADDPETSVGYQYYLDEGVKAFEVHEYKKAVRYFRIAQIFDPDSKTAQQYLAVLKERRGEYFPVTAQKLPVEDSSKAVEKGPTTQVQTKTPAAIYIPSGSKKRSPVVLSLAQIISMSSGQTKPKLQIEWQSSLIIEGKNIQRFLVIDEGFINVKIIDTDHIQIDALRMGSTFLHIWDGSGRNVLYIEVIFPKIFSVAAPQASNGVTHGKPFTVSYTNDWTQYYDGKNIAGLKRQSTQFQETLAVNGETPYGFFDTFGAYSDFNAVSQFDSYTIGLSQIPLYGTSNFNIRGYNASRDLSPLTMDADLKGIFADVDILHDTVGVSLSHGQLQQSYGFITGSSSTKPVDSYIDAIKLTLFPKSMTDQYSFNFASGYGQDRAHYLPNHVYSVDGLHKFNDNLTLNAEQATDSTHDATLAALRWQKGGFTSGINFRNVDKSYLTITGTPSYLGETGATWTTSTNFQNVWASSYFEAYQNHLSNNPNHPRAMDYNGNGQLHVTMTPTLSNDLNMNYQNTAADISPTSSLSVNDRISKSFGIWNGLQGAVFAGPGYQNNYGLSASDSDYNRENALVGIQLPVTHEISLGTSYEYDWWQRPYSSSNAMASVINANASYQKQLTSKLSLNTQVNFRDEFGVRSNSNSFFAGEQSVILSAGFNYIPKQDVSIFGDLNADRIISHVGNPASDSFEFHLGMRVIFGTGVYWDPVGTVSGVVFKDRNGSGRFAADDEGIAGVKVHVGDKFCVTDKYGRYRVRIHAKFVDVSPVQDSVPGGLIFSSPQTVNVRIIQNGISHVDFGLLIQTGVYGLIFVDKSGIGVPHDGDKFIGRIRIILDGNTSERTDAHGAFYFRDIAPGKHTIAIDMNSLPINMLPLIKIKNTIDVAEGTNYQYNVPVKLNASDNT